jgi:3,4-dihydroxy 2-butanone 4-phosphate synthase/GTP cyclohydrolase II
MEVAREHNLKIISIDDLIAYRMRTERLVKREVSTVMNTVFGEFEVIAYTDVNTGDCHLVLKKGTWTDGEPVLVRMHSSSETGDLLGILLEDYGTKVNNALKSIAAEGKGAFVYLHQHDKSNLLAKLNHFKQLSDNGTPEKFELHTPMGNKDMGVGAQILRDLQISKIRLLTNHPRKRSGFIGYGLEIVENIGF